MRPAIRVAAVAALALSLLACAPSRVASTWSEPGRTPSPYRNLLVFGVAANGNVRRAYEDGFVRALGDEGTSARSGSKLLPAGGLGGVDAVVKAVSLSGADAVIVTHFIGEQTRASSAPAQRPYVAPGNYRSLSAYYEGVYDDVTDPGYYSSYESLRLETNLYDARRQTLVWSARSATLDPTSERTTISEVIKEVTREMASAGFLAPRQAATP